MPEKSAGLPAVDVLGVKINSLTLPLAVDQIGRWIDEGAREYVCVTGVHGVMEAQRDPVYRALGLPHGESDAGSARAREVLHRPSLITPRRRA